MSNSVIREMKNNLDWCVKNAYSDSDDVNFGRCILHSTSMSCTNHIEGRNLTFVQLKSTFNFEKDFAQLTEQNEFQNSVSIYPVYDHKLIYKFNMYFAAVSLLKYSLSYKASPVYCIFLEEEVIQFKGILKILKLLYK